MTYIPIALNHFRSLRRQAQAAGLSASMDMSTFEVEVKGYGRYATFYPQFLCRAADGRLIYAAHLADEAFGFIGWLPYRPVSWDPVSDKLAFKALLNRHALHTPALIERPEISDTAWVLKMSAGSFGDDVRGPFSPRHSFTAPSPPASARGRGRAFAEAFVSGDILKVWYWGRQAFFAHRHGYPTITGDGKREVSSLLRERLGQSGVAHDIPGDQTAIAACLAFQGVTETTVLAAGDSCWIDFRYGRRYSPSPPTYQSDSALSCFDTGLLAQLAQVGEVVGSALESRFGAPILFSVDGVIDASSRVAWLEANTNPMLPPEGYECILSTMFRIDTRQNQPTQHTESRDEP